MENNERIVVGLDIGTTKVCAIVGKYNDYGKINVLGVGRATSDGVKRGVVVNIDKTVKAIQKAIELAEKQSGVPITDVYVGIAGEHIRSTQNNHVITLKNQDQAIVLEDVKRLHKEAHKIATPPGTEIIHILPQDYVVDNQRNIKEPIGMPAVRLEGNFHIVMGQTTAAKTIYKCVRQAGLEVNQLILEPLASSSSVLSEEEKQAGVCLVDIGGGTTDIAIFEDNIIRHTAVIPFGGNIISEDIKKECVILPRQAEALKVKFGSALETEITDDEIITIPGFRGGKPKEIRKSTLAGIIQARMEEIMEFIAMEIKNSGYENRLVAGVVITGGGALLQHVRQLVEYVTCTDARVGKPSEHLAQGMVDEVNSPMYATATGLLMLGLQDKRKNIPQKFVTEKGTLEQNNDKTSVSFSGNFLKNIKQWFEDTIQGSSEFIE